MNSDSNAEEIVTERVQPLEEGTWRMESRAPMAASPAIVSRKGPLGALEPGTVICGDCVVIRTHHNHESGRPGLFECQGSEGHVMVKVAATDYPPQPQLWSLLSQLRHPRVLRIFRTLEEDGRFYEVQEFCSGGTLADYVPYAGSGRPIPSGEWIERSLVPTFHAGISYLHAQGIVHRDIKPSNLYLREQDGKKSLLIGDFDISSVLQTGRTSRSTERLAGTWVYSAPEAFPRFVDQSAKAVGASVVRSSDYYSFGVVIVELLLGTTSLHQAELPDLYDFYLQSGRVEIPEGLSPRLTELLGGLLCRNRHRRWGDEEVGRWLQGQTTDEDRQRIVQDRGFQLGRSTTPYTAFEKFQPTTLVELGQAMAAEPAIAQDELMSGDILLHWIGQLDSGIARNIRQDRDKWRFHPAIALLCARLRLDPDAPYVLDVHHQARSAREWHKMALSLVARDNHLAADLVSKEKLLELGGWLRLKAAPEVDAASRVDGVVTTYFDPADAGSPPNFMLLLEELGYAFQLEKPYLLAAGVAATSPGQIANLSLGKETDWTEKPPATYLSSCKRWQNGHLEAYLRQRLIGEAGTPSALLAQLKQVRGNFSDKPFVAFEIILRLLDPEIPPLQLELDPALLSEVHVISYGEETHLSIPYKVYGPGMPFAAVRMKAPNGGAMLETHEVSYRRGEIKVHLQTRGDIPTRRDFQAVLSLESNTTQLVGGRASLTYRVSYPASITFRRVVAGASTGAIIMGLARLTVTPVAPHAIGWQQVHFLSRSTTGVWGLILAAMGIAFYAAFRIWTRALAQLAR